jgi:hypothetical protein
VRLQRPEEALRGSPGAPLVFAQKSEAAYAPCKFASSPHRVGWWGSGAGLGEGSCLAVSSAPLRDYAASFFRSASVPSSFASRRCARSAGLSEDTGRSLTTLIHCSPCSLGSSHMSHASPCRKRNELRDFELSTMRHVPCLF